MRRAQGYVPTALRVVLVAQAEVPARGLARRQLARLLVRRTASDTPPTRRRIACPETPRRGRQRRKSWERRQLPAAAVTTALLRGALRYRSQELTCERPSRSRYLPCHNIIIITILQPTIAKPMMACMHGPERLDGCECVRSVSSTNGTFSLSPPSHKSSVETHQSLQFCRPCCLLDVNPDHHTSGPQLERQGHRRSQPVPGCDVSIEYLPLAQQARQRVKESDPEAGTDGTQ
jgi:hypothetical protein